MAGFYRALGRAVRRKLLEANWMFQAITGTDDDAIEAEYGVGREMAAAMEAQLPQDQRPTVDEGVNACGSRLGKCVKNRKRRFAFRVLPHPHVNAFVLPGGFVYITQPLLALCGADADCLAAALGHEMAHVICSHAKDRILGNSLFSLLTRAIPGSPALGQSMRRLANQFLEAAYSQDQELEADSLGTRLVSAAGFDPAGAIRLLGLLKELAESGSDECSYFVSHPPFAERLEKLRQLLKA
jgi:predicted Zn-dependent protease